MGGWGASVTDLLAAWLAGSVMRLWMRLEIVNAL